MLRKLLDLAGRAARVAACAALLAGVSGALAQGIASPEPSGPVAGAPTTLVQSDAGQTNKSGVPYDLIYFALAASLLSLIGVGFLIFSKSKQPGPTALRTAGIDMTPLPKQLSTEQSREVEEIVKRVLRQQGGAPAAQVAQPAQNLPKQSVNQPAKRTTAPPPPEAPVATAPPAAVATPIAAEAAAPEVPAEPTPAPPAPVGPKRAYVSSAPVNGRFRRNVLQGQPAHNSIYELTWDPVRPDETTFQVNPDVASHPRHISSYADVLEPACEFNLPQGAASRIVTEAPGLLRRVDGDDWEIVRKARIYFA